MSRLAAFAAATLVLGAIGCGRAPAPAVERVDAAHAAKLLIDRNWIDRMPATQDDHLHVFRFVPTMGGGVFQDRVLFKGQFELFKFDVAGDTIAFDLPAEHQHATSRFHIDVVDGPHPFDLRLTLDDSPRGPHVYYGMRSETPDRALDDSLPAALTP